MIGKVYSCPKEVCESGQMVVVGLDTSPEYNPTRHPWWLQVREYRDGEAFGTWIPVTKTEFMEWNPNVSIPNEQRVSRRIEEPAPQSAEGPELSS